MKTKHPSGHAGREKARQKKAAPLKAEWAARYEKIGPPPDDSVGRVDWAGKVCALMIYEQLTAPSLRTTKERKLILEGVRTLGMTAVKALYEERLKKIESTLYGRRNGKGSSDALDGLEPDPTARSAQKV